MPARRGGAAAEEHDAVDEELDVLVVGAGLSGIAAAYRLQTECSQKRFAILEARSSVGGTWDLFRYPGVRSDSDMFTLGFAFRPWRDAKAIADGPAILRYIRETAEEFGIEPLIRFEHKVVSASWSSAESAWLVEVDTPDGRRRYRTRFLHLCAGYYSYDEGYQPELPGRERFSGDFVNPQFWHEDLDYEGKKVVVIGSGATAVTLVPAMAESAADVTMLQRSPTYMVALPAKDPLADLLRRHLPERAAHGLARWKNVLMMIGFYQYCRRRPAAAKALLLKGVQRCLPDYDLDPDFVPRYNPWDQRLCLIPNADLFRAIRHGKASVVTDQIEKITPGGIDLVSGSSLEAEVIVSATGFNMIACGGIALSVDGAPVALGERLIYRGFMLSDVPNLAFAVGYTNASWTLRSDLCTRMLCRLINHMDRNGYTKAVPVPRSATAVPFAALDLTSGYIVRALDRLPKQGSRRPWKVRQNYVLDLVDMKLSNVATEIDFSGPPAQTSWRGSDADQGGGMGKPASASARR